MMEHEENLLVQFRNDPERAFPKVFRRYYAMVCDKIYRVLGNPSEVEDIAQDIFFELYQKRDQLEIKSSIPAYLRRMAHTRTLNHIRDKKWKWKEDEEVLERFSDHAPAPNEVLAAEDMNAHMSAAIDKLPEKCRLIFGLKRFEGMSNRQIAEQLGISVKTVENQMTTALKRLKSAYRQYEENE